MAAGGRCDVAVVGGGLSGLVAAAAVRAAGRSVVVLEARDRVGGRIETATFADGTRVDLGATWVGPHQRRVNALADRLGVARFRSAVPGRVLVVPPAGAPAGRVAAASALAAAAAQRLTLARLDRAAARVDLERPWLTPGAGALDGRTLDDWLRRARLGRRSGATVRRVLTGLFAEEPHRVSLLHALFYVRSNGGTRALFAGDGGAQQDRLAGGAARLAEALAETLGDAVRTGAAVEAVEHEGGRVRLATAAGAVDARHAVVAVPPRLCERIAFAPELPARRRELQRRAPHGAVTKVALRYEDAFWRRDGLSGTAFGPELPFSFTVDLTPPEAQGGVLGVYLIGPRATAHAERGERRLDVLLERVGAVLGPAAAAPAEVLERDWQAEHWSGGAWGAYYGPGLWTAVEDAVRAPVDGVSWAGSESAVVSNNYLDGAVEAGERAAAEALAALDRR